MNTVNKSTNFSPFQLKYGHSPHVIPPLVVLVELERPSEASSSSQLAEDTITISRLKTDVMEAQDNLLRAKVEQAAQANKLRTLTFPYMIGQ